MERRYQLKLVKVKNANQIIFRSSGSGYLMVESRNKKEIISDTTKTNLIDIFVSAVYGRREEIKSKFLKKGNACEEDAITLLSRVTKIVFKKNTQRLNNEFITGEPDLFIGKAIDDAEETFDTKASWSLHTFWRAKKGANNKNYYWQGQCYMMLTGAKKHTVAYCLVNGLASAIRSEKLMLSYEPGMLDKYGNEMPKYIELCKQIEINHIFDIELFKTHNPGFEFHNDITQWEHDIPIQERVHMVTYKRDMIAINSLITKIRICRNWMNRELFEL